MTVAAGMRSHSASQRALSRSITVTLMPDSFKSVVRYTAILPPPIISTFFTGFLYLPTAVKSFLSSRVGPVMLSLSPPRSTKSPFGIYASPPRSTTLTSTAALKLPCRLLSCIPSSFSPGRTRCSTISTLPFENTSTRAALGKRRMRDISRAHSSSGLTIMERPSVSRRKPVWLIYSGSRMRAMTCFVPSLRAAMPHIMFTSSLRVDATMRSASLAPAPMSDSGFVALPSMHMTSSPFETWFMISPLLSMTVMSCPSWDSVCATAKPLFPAPAMIIFMATLLISA